MITFIPGELIALVTFPGIIFHEIAHRFFCDLLDVPVYGVRYFVPLSQQAGCVAHAPANKFLHTVLIANGPFIINSLICILFMIPYGMPIILKTDFVMPHSKFLDVMRSILFWIGLSAGFHAVPSSKDIEGLIDLKRTGFFATCLVLYVAFVKMCNLNYVGFLARCFYTMGLSLLLPKLLLLIFKFS